MACKDTRHPAHLSTLNHTLFRGNRTWEFICLWNSTWDLSTSCSLLPSIFPSFTPKILLQLFFSGLPHRATPNTPANSLSPPRSSHYSPSAFPSHAISRSLSDTFCMAAIKCLSPENIQNKEAYLVGLRPSPGNLYYLYMLWQGGAWRMWPVLGTS